MVVTGFSVDLGVAVPQAVGNACSDVLAKGILTAAARYPIDRAYRATVPPRPIGIANHTGSGGCGLTRAVIPANSANCVGSELLTQRNMHYGIERPRILPGTCSRRRQ